MLYEAFWNRYIVDFSGIILELNPQFRRLPKMKIFKISSKYLSNFFHFQNDEKTIASIPFTIDIYK